MIKPNFFIIGAGGCGTTALYKYLQLHPNIFITTPKEPNYFAIDIPEVRVFTQLEKYLELYKACQPEQVAIGEASAWYFNSSAALPNIYQFNPDAKIIVMIRNPIDRMYSSYCGQRNIIFNEDQDSFEQAWRLQEVRKQGKMLPKHCRVPKLLQYGQIGKLNGQFEQLYSIFPPEQVKVIIFDDFVTDTQRIYQETLAFLGVINDNRTDFKQHNSKNKIYKIKLLSKFTQHPPQFLSKLLNRWKWIRDIKNTAIEQINEWNSIGIERLPLSEDFHRELKAFFQDDVTKISKLLGRDLTHWVK